MNTGEFLKLVRSMRLVETGERLMKMDEFVRLVKRMRQLQREYFKLGKGLAPPQLITDAKRYEVQVDKAIKELSEPQGRLFGDD